MSRRRLERGYWNGRQVRLTGKEEARLFVYRPERGKWFHRFGVSIKMDWPYPDKFSVEGRLPRKSKKALWKHFNGRPEQEMKNGVLEYNGFSWGTRLSTPGLLHKGMKA